MNTPQIELHHLTKTYRVPVRSAGLGASLTNLLRRTYRPVEAVHDLTFFIEAGQMVGLIGPNGAGKTTTLKLLCGLLHPSRGQARVAGFVPWERRHAYLSRISMVLGNKSQLLWDIPPLDSFHVLAEIYRVPAAQFKRNLAELVELLDMEALLTQPVRTLSLGERMKCELVAGLIHQPDVLFLDEPTLGLDVSMQGRLRRFLAEYNRRRGVTVILTSHYMADVAALCPRVILIHHGQLLYDGELHGLARRLAPFKLVRAALRAGRNGHSLNPELPAGAEMLAQENGQLTVRVARSETPAFTAWLLNSLPVADLAVEEPPLEAVIDQIYQEGTV